MFLYPNFEAKNLFVEECVVFFYSINEMRYVWEISNKEQGIIPNETSAHIQEINIHKALLNDKCSQNWGLRGVNNRSETEKKEKRIRNISSCVVNDYSKKKMKQKKRGKRLRNLIRKSRLFHLKSRLFNHISFI